MISEFAKSEIQPIAAQIDKTEEFPYETVKKMVQNQLMGIPFDEKYGGAGQQTTAERVGDEYILNGNKIFIPNGASADVFIVFAMTAPDKGVKGISAFIVEKTFEGFEVGKVEDKLGIRASSTAELIFQDCHVPAENLIGGEGRGFSIAMKTLDSGRIGIAAQALGIAEGAFAESVNYMKERKQFGRSIAKFQGLQWMLADMDVKIDATRELVHKAVELKESKQPFSVAAARAKLFSAETAMEVTTKAIQIFVGYGYTKDYPVERMFRDAKITEIYEGTSEPVIDQGWVDKAYQVGQPGKTVRPRL